MLLKDKVALVTGGGSGIGRAVALALAREGAQVLVTDMNAAAGNDTVERINTSGGTALFNSLNVAKVHEHVCAVDMAVKHFGALHIACNNAGISTGRSGAYRPLAEVECDDWSDILDVNLSGVFYGMRAQISAMLRFGGGAIVNVASVMGQVAGLGLSPYVASKHGVIGLTKAAAIDYAQQGIRVNSVGPGYIDTPMLAQKDKQVLERLAALHPMGRLGKTEEIAEIIIWLCSERASFVTGAYYPVDGGFLSQ